MDLKAAGWAKETQIELLGRHEQETYNVNIRQLACVSERSNRR